MSVIQNIRDKYAKIAVIAVALAMLGFILMDAFSSRSKLFGGRSTAIGSVNGTKIDVNDFNQQVTQLEQEARAKGAKVSGDEMRMQINKSVWENSIDNILVADEVKKLGLGVGAKELNEIIYVINPPAELANQYTDPSTGKFDGAQAQQAVRQISNGKDENTKQYLNRLFERIENNAIKEKYLLLVYNSVNFPKWFVQQRIDEEGKAAQISMVKIPYTSVPDNQVKVSDKDIEKYINEHKELFKVKENRSIEYVVFNAAPNSGDSAKIKTEVENLKPTFEQTKNTELENFIARSGSAVRYKDLYLTPKQVRFSLGLVNDSTSYPEIFNYPINVVEGPSIIESNYTLLKKVEEKMLPDSVKCRHILIATYNPQTQQQILPDTVAHFKIDSIAEAIRKGANFEVLEELYTSDQAAHQKKGVMTFSCEQIQTQVDKDFGKFILYDGKPGMNKVLKSQFGYHYIEIMDFIKPQTRYKFAFLAKPINASEETDNTANNQANELAGKFKDISELNKYLNSNAAKGLKKLYANDIRPEDFEVNGLGVSRQFVKAIFAAKKNEVLQVSRVGDNYVVAAVTQINKEGIASVAQARSVVEPILINKQKAKIIAKQIGTITSLDDVAAKMKVTIEKEDSLMFNNISEKLGYEMNVVGASFATANAGKLITTPIEGQQGVYVLKVDALHNQPVPNNNVDLFRMYLIKQTTDALMKGEDLNGNESTYQPFEILRQSATIKDFRSEFY